MNWFDKNVWKQCLVSTFLCLVGCSIGTMGVLLFLADQNWLFAFVISLGIGFITCVLFIVFWSLFFLKIEFKEAVKSSFKMSIVSMMIMIVTENIFIIALSGQHSDHQMSRHFSDNLLIMLLGMMLGFLFALPYNYYVLFKTGENCHKT